MILRSAHRTRVFTHISRDDALRHERLARAIPLIRNPLSPKGQEEDPKPTWLDLFFDLSVVACLSAFGNSHEAVTGADVGGYIAYIVVVWWSWASVVIYDAKYARADLYKRFFKFLQICTLAFTAAYSRGFRPNVLAPHSVDYALAGQGLAEEPDAEILRAQISWDGLTIAFAVGRFLQILQYSALILFLGRRIKLSVILPLVGAIISACVWLGVHYIDAVDARTNSVRLGLGYATIALEMLLAIVASRLQSVVPTHAHLLIERFSLLTLIILGEGLIGLTRQFGIAVSVFGFAPPVYLQVFCAVALYFFIFHLIFEPLNPHARMSLLRTHCWGILHLPLHFCTLLWLESVIGIVIFEVFATATTRLTNLALTLADQLDRSAGMTALILPAAQLQSAAHDLELLDLSLASVNGSITQGLQYINSLQVNATMQTTLLDSLAYIVVGQLFIQMMSTYNLQPDEEVRHTINAYFSQGFSVSAPLVGQDQLNELVTGSLQMLLRPSLFAFPTAGGILLMSVLLTVVQRPPRDRFDYLLLGPRAVLGAIFCLLGLLDIGRQTITPADLANSADGDVTESGDLSSVYTLLYRQWILPILTICIVILIAFEWIVLLIAKRTYHSHEREAIPPVDATELEKAETDDAVPDSETAEARAIREAPIPD